MATYDDTITVEIIDMHRTLAEWHRERADNATIDVLREHHGEVAELLAQEAEGLEDVIATQRRRSAHNHPAERGEAP
jgi:hypothetical protein